MGHPFNPQAIHLLCHLYWRLLYLSLYGALLNWKTSWLTRLCTLDVFNQPGEGSKSLRYISIRSTLYNVWSMEESKNFNDLISISQRLKIAYKTFKSGYIFLTICACTIGMIVYLNSHQEDQHLYGEDKNEAKRFIMCFIIPDPWPHFWRLKRWKVGFWSLNLKQMTLVDLVYPLTLDIILHHVFTNTTICYYQFFLFNCGFFIT